MPASTELLDKVVELVNKAKVEAKEQKTYLLAQVWERNVGIARRHCCWVIHGS